MVRLEEDYIELIKEIFGACDIDGLDHYSTIEDLAKCAIKQDDALTKVIGIIEDFRATG